MSATAKLHAQLRDEVTVERTVVEEKEIIMAKASHLPRSIGSDGRKSLYVTSGAMFAGLAGAFLFAAPGAVLGATAGALAGLLFAQHRPSA
jgi:uncharacterized membrane protein